MSATLNTTFTDDIEFVADGVDNFCELIKRTARPIQLPAAVIGYHYSGAAYVNGPLCIGNTHDALQCKMTSPLGANLFGIVPCH